MSPLPLEKRLPANGNSRPAALIRFARLLLERESQGAAVAKLLHDDIGPALMAAGLHLRALDAEGTLPVLGYLDGVMERVRQASQALHFNPMDRAGLAPALERLAAEFQEKRGFQVACRLDISHRYPAGVTYSLYRIVELALDNAARHSGVQEASVQVTGSENGLTASVTDCGRGFDLARARAEAAGTGLILMEIYAEKESLQLRATSVPGQGTIVELSLLP